MHEVQEILPNLEQENHEEILDKIIRCNKIIVILKMIMLEMYHHITIGIIELIEDGIMNKIIKTIKITVENNMGKSTQQYS